jgi:hypothetical protein
MKRDEMATVTYTTLTMPIGIATLTWWNTEVATRRLPQAVRGAVTTRRLPQAVRGARCISR